MVSNVLVLGLPICWFLVTSVVVLGYQCVGALLPVCWCLATRVLVPGYWCAGIWISVCWIGASVGDGRGVMVVVRSFAGRVCMGVGLFFFLCHSDFG